MKILSKARAALRRYRDFDPEQAYLEEAVSLIDLEARQRQIDNGMFRRQRRLPY